ncbi:MAG: hypothetical protein CMJ78_24225 [Planctomycetaceae bacterium]|nr:hypothetical protein [Planctomycetaceae bacterium]
MIEVPAKHRILVVDDEPDIFSITRLSLRGMKFGGRGVELVQATSGTEAVKMMREQPLTSVILLDVVMESQTAGLDACNAVRNDLGNRMTRILLRTGQPGIAPEKQAIDEYDIDGYLLKTELSSTRLYAAVRTALKAFEELVDLQRHRELLKFVHDSACRLHSFDTIETSLQRILMTATAITNAPLGVLSLQTFEEQGDPQTCSMHIADDDDEGAEAAGRITKQIAADANAQAMETPAPFGDGHLIPLVLHRELGNGWIYLEGGNIDESVSQILPLLASHASNALYSVVAQAMLEDREGPFYNSIVV